MANVVKREETMVSVTWSNGVAHLEPETVMVEKPGLVNFTCYAYKFPFSGKERSKRLEREKNDYGKMRRLSRQHGRRNLGQKAKYKTGKKGSPRMAQILQQDYEAYCEFCDMERLAREAEFATMMDCDELEEEFAFEAAPDQDACDMKVLEDLYQEEIAVC